MQKQIAVRHVWANVTPSPLQLIDEFLPSVQPGIRDNPVAFFETRRLPLVFRLVRRSQQSMTHADGAIEANFARVWTSKRQKIGQGFEQRPVNRRVVPMEDANETTQMNTPLLEIRPFDVRKGDALAATATRRTPEFPR